MEAYTKVTLIELIGYREWTESLGDDREWAIQSVQASIYRAAQEEAKDHGGFIIPLRFDYMILLSSGLDEYSQRAVVRSVEERSPVPVRAASGCAPTPIDALRVAEEKLKKLPPSSVETSGCGASEVTAVAHIDVDDITGATHRDGVYEAFLEVLRLHKALAEVAAASGAVVQYLGGDNILVVLPPSDPLRETESLVASVEHVLPRGMTLKAGVGVASRARNALSLAARALHAIRSGAAERRILLIEEPLSAGGLGAGPA